MRLLRAAATLLPEPFRADRTCLRTLLRWAALGILIRLLLMPFTLSYDRVALDMFPVLLPQKGIWDIYSHLRDNFGASIAEQGWFYYSPLTYFSLGAWHLVVRALVPGFDQWMAASRDIFAAGGGHLQHYAQAAADAPLLRALWLLKLPLLAADLGIGLLFLRLAGSPAAGLRSFKLWMLNPATLYATYVFGQFEIVDAFFLVAALTAAHRRRPALAMALLGVAASFKTLPLLLLVPQGALLLGSTWRDRIRLLLVGMLPYTVAVVPLIISSHGFLVTQFLHTYVFFYYGGQQPPSRLALAVRALAFVALVALVLEAALRRRTPGAASAVLMRHWALTLLLVFLARFIEFHYFTWLSPLLVLLAGARPRLIPLYIAQVLSLVPWTFSPGWNWWSLLAPLGPDFFPALPTPEALLIPLLPWGYLSRASWYLWIALSLAIAVAIARELLPSSWAHRTAAFLSRDRRHLARWPPWAARTGTLLAPAGRQVARWLPQAAGALVAIVALIAVTAALPALRPGHYHDIHQVFPPNDFTPALSPATTVGQSFVPSFNRLAIIEVYLSLERRSQPALFVLELRDSQGNPVGREQRSSQGLQEGFARFAEPRDSQGNPVGREQRSSQGLQEGFARFAIDPIGDTASQRYTLLLSSSAGPESDRIRVGIARSPYSHTATGGHWSLNGVPREADLAFQTYHVGQSDLGVVWSGIRRRVAADPTFFIAYGSLLLLTLAGLLVSLLRPLGGAGAGPETHQHT